MADVLGTGLEPLQSIQPTATTAAPPIVHMPEVQTPWTDLAQTFERAGSTLDKQAALSDAAFVGGVQNDTDRQFLDLEAQFSNDPQGFLATSNALLQGTGGNVPSRLWPSLRDSLVQKQNAIYGAILMKHTDQVTANGIKAAQGARDQSLATATNMLANGVRADDPRVVQAMATYRSAGQILKASGATNDELLSYDEANAKRETFVAAATPSVMSAWQEGGRAQATGVIEQIANSDQYVGTPEERQAIRSSFYKHLDELDAGANSGLTLIKPQVTGLVDQSEHLALTGDQLGQFNSLASKYMNTPEGASFFGQAAAKINANDFGRDLLSMSASELDSTYQSFAGTSVKSPIAGVSDAQYGGLRAGLRARESSNNSKSDPGFGALGFYQFTPPALAQVGLIDPAKYEAAGGDTKVAKGAAAEAFLKDPNNWTLPGGAQAFLANPATQDDAFDRLTASNYQVAVQKGFIKPGMTGPQKVAILAGMHLGGASGVQAVLSGGDVSDDLGTPVSSYMALGQQWASLGAGNVAPQSLAALGEKGGQRAQQLWDAVKPQLAKDSDVPPDMKSVNALLDFAQGTHLTKLAEDISTTLTQFSTEKAAEAQPPGIVDALIAKAQMITDQTGADAQTAAKLAGLRDAHAKVISALDDDPLAYRARTNPDLVKITDIRFGTPNAPQDVAQAQAAAAAVEKHDAGYVGDASGETAGTVNFMTKPQMRAFASWYANASPGEQVQAIADVAAGTDARHFIKWATDLGEKAGAPDIRQAASMALSDPATASLVIAGQKALKTVKGVAPSDETLTASINQRIGNLLATSPVRADVVDMIKAVYAALNQQQGNLSATADSDTIDGVATQAAQQVTGGILEMNGHQITAPVRGMKQWQLDAVMNHLTDDDLANFHDAHNQPITAANFRNAGYLTEAGPPGAYKLIVPQTGGPDSALINARTNKPAVILIPPMMSRVQKVALPPAAFGGARAL